MSILYKFHLDILSNTWSETKLKIKLQLQKHRLSRFISLVHKNIGKSEHIQSLTNIDMLVQLTEKINVVLNINMEKHIYIHIYFYIYIYIERAKGIE